MPTIQTHTSTSRRTPRPRRQGSTLLLTMIFLALFGTMAMGFHAASNMNLRQAHGYHGVQNAQLAAESGMAFMLTALSDLVIPNEVAEADLLLAVANALAAKLDGTGNMGAAGIAYDGTTISTPVVEWGNDGHTFQAWITTDEVGDLRLTVRGAWRSAERVAQITLATDTAWSPVFDYGIASKGKIVLAGQGSVQGTNDPGEANIFSATYSDPEAVLISGNVKLSGSVSTANPDSYITIDGNPSIGGTSDKTKIQDYLHVGVGDPIFPEIDTSAFEAEAVNVFDPATDMSKDMVLDNIRIPAGTNPVFSSNVTIRGVVYIEEPNSVSFEGSTEIIGTIVTADPGPWTFYDNTISFSGNVSSQGVDALPDEPQFAALKQLTGSTILAPGFGVTFAGNYSALNGAIAAEKFIMTGNAGGTIGGPIICYGDTELEVLGNSKITIDRSSFDRLPAGFKLPIRLVALAGTYREL